MRGIKQALYVRWRQSLASQSPECCAPVFLGDIKVGSHLGAFLSSHHQYQSVESDDVLQSSLADVVCQPFLQFGLSA